MYQRPQSYYLVLFQRKGTQICPMDAIPKTYTLEPSSNLSVAMQHRQGILNASRGCKSLSQT